MYYGLSLINAPSGDFPAYPRRFVKRFNHESIGRSRLGERPIQRASREVAGHVDILATEYPAVISAEVVNLNPVAPRRRDKR